MGVIRIDWSGVLTTDHRRSCPVCGGARLLGLPPEGPPQPGRPSLCLGEGHPE
jgi:hypothetical protein